MSQAQTRLTFEPTASRWWRMTPPGPSSLNLTVPSDWDAGAAAGRAADDETMSQRALTAATSPGCSESTASSATRGPPHCNSSTTETTPSQSRSRTDGSFHYDVPKDRRGEFMTPRHLVGRDAHGDVVLDRPVASVALLEKQDSMTSVLPSTSLTWSSAESSRAIRRETPTRTSPSGQGGLRRGRPGGRRWTLHSTCVTTLAMHRLRPAVPPGRFAARSNLRGDHEGGQRPSRRAGPPRNR